MPLEDDIIRLTHMLDAAKEAQRFMTNRRREDLEADRLLSFGVVHAIEIVGEAAGKVSPESRSQWSSIPWASIVAMRNRLIHGYFEIDYDRVWSTVTNNLPPLIAELERILASEDKPTP